MMRVLMVEDDSALASFLCRGLSLDGHAVTVMKSSQAKGSSAKELRPDIILLDLDLRSQEEPDMLAVMGARFPSTQMMVLTARKEMEETVRCLELGADDVMQKPFSFQELRARLNALGRRRGQFGESVLRVGELELDRVERRVTQAGLAIDLTATEFSLLEALLRRRGERVCSRAELLREVWNMPQAMVEAGANSNIVEVYINYLRKKLRAGTESVIRTVRGKGYVLDAGCHGEEIDHCEQVGLPLSGGPLMAGGWNAGL